MGLLQVADRLAANGFDVSKSTVQNLLVAHGLGRRAQRLARTAAIAAMTTGLVTESAVDVEPLGFCHRAGAPGALVSVDSFYIGNLKGVGKVHQLTAVDTFSRWAVVWIVHGPVTADISIQFLERIRQQWARLGYPIRAVVADNGPEYVASRFADALARAEITRIKIPARSPNHNAVVERFSGTMLQECWRPAFHRRHFTSIRQLQREADSWLITYKPGAATTATTWPADDPSTCSNYPHDNPNHRPLLSPRLPDRKYSTGRARGSVPTAPLPRCGAG